jgi:hypothetical protein
MRRWPEKARDQKLPKGSSGKAKALLFFFAFPFFL